MDQEQHNRFTRRITILGLIIIVIICAIAARQERCEARLQEEMIEDMKHEQETFLLYNNLIDATQAYIDMIAPRSSVSAENIINLCDSYNIDLCFVLAQAQAESHFGTRGIASKTHSIFNVKAYDWTTADAMIRNGHGYSHPDDSVEPYIRLLKNEYLIDGRTTDDLLNNYVNYNGDRFASSKTYESQLRSIYKKICSTTDIYELYNQYQESKYNI